MAVTVPKIKLWGAIITMCKYCMYGPVGGIGTWREQVEACTSYTCPLFKYRPVSKDNRRIIHDQLPTQWVDQENS